MEAYSYDELVDDISEDDGYDDDSLEQWEQIEGYSNYFISNYGNVLNDTTGRVLTPRPNKTGHLRVTLSLNGVREEFYITTLIGMHFIDGYHQECCYFRHADGDISNNYVDNLTMIHMRTCKKHPELWSVESR